VYQYQEPLYNMSENSASLNKGDEPIEEDSFFDENDH